MKQEFEILSRYRVCLFRGVLHALKYNKAQNDVNECSITVYNRANQL